MAREEFLKNRPKMSYLSLTKRMFPSPPADDLLESVKRNDIDAIKTLIKFNKDLLTYVYPVTSKTIFLTACSERGVNSTTIQTLIDLDANIEGHAEWKPLHLAAENPNSAILEIIIKKIGEKKINETVEGKTALHSLIKSEAINKENEHRFCDNIELLLQAGINVNQVDFKDMPAIFWAAKKGYRNVIKTILEKSLDHVDLDSHTLRNKSARDYIEEKNLYHGPLPEKILHRDNKDKIFSLIKRSFKREQEDEVIKYFDELSVTETNDFVNWDDGTLTLLQYCCEIGLSSAAKYLLNKGADKTKTINKTKTPLELVAINGYYEILEMLVKDPTDVKVSPSIFCYLIKHSNNTKSDKIDHEKCCKIILEKLESGRIILDVNGEDELKNSPIHYSLRYADEATTQKLFKLGASLSCKNSFGFMPIEYIKPELLKHHLDHCVEKKDEKGDSKFLFAYGSLLPPRKLEKGDRFDPESGRKCNDVIPETEVIAYMSKAPELQYLLKHPVIVSFLLMKWYRIRLLFYTNLLFYIFFVASLIAYIFTSYVYFDREKISDFCLGLSKLSLYTLHVTFWILVLREISQIAFSGGKYFRNFENYVKIFLVFTTETILYKGLPTDDIDTKKLLASIAILLAAFELVLMGKLYPRFSANVVMLKTVSVNYFKLLWSHSLLLIAFGLSLSILFTKTEQQIKVNVTCAEDKEKDLFKGPGESIFKTIVMLTGEFDASSINFDPYPIVGRLIFTVFVFMIPIMLMNLLNGLAVNDTQIIKNKADLQGHIARAQHISYVESVLFGAILRRSAFFKPLARRICLFSSDNYKLTILPNGKIFFEDDSSPKRRPNSFGAWLQSRSDPRLDKKTVNLIFTEI